MRPHRHTASSNLREAHPDEYSSMPTIDDIAFWKLPFYHFKAIQVDYNLIRLILRMKMRSLMPAVPFAVHTNNDTVKHR